MHASTVINSSQIKCTVRRRTPMLTWYTVESSSEGATNTRLKAYGIDPERVEELYFKNREACYDDILNMLLDVKPGQRVYAMKAILDGYFAMKEFVDSKINQTEIEITALEHRVKESKNLVEMTKSISTLGKVPFPPDLDKKAEPGDPATLKPFPHPPCPTCLRKDLLCSPNCMTSRFYNDCVLWSLIPRDSDRRTTFDRLRKNFMEFEVNPRRFEIVKTLAYGTYRSAFYVSRQHGYQYYYEDQLRQNNLELEAARRTLREFRIMRDIHNKAMVEGYNTRNEGIPDTTEQKRNTKKDKGKKVQKVYAMLIQLVTDDTY
ncbi:hypothetical protein HN51_006292 [Arachis hypogaea]